MIAKTREFGFASLPIALKIYFAAYFLGILTHIAELPHLLDDGVLLFLGYRLQGWSSVFASIFKQILSSAVLGGLWFRATWTVPAATLFQIFLFINEALNRDLSRQIAASIDPHATLDQQMIVWIFATLAVGWIIVFRKYSRLFKTEP